LTHSRGQVKIALHTFLLDLKPFSGDLGMLNEYSRPHVPEDQPALERSFRTLRQSEVYQMHDLQALQSTTGPLSPNGKNL